MVRGARSTADREACWQIRRAVFIEEQRVPEALERDGLDDVALHLAAWRDGTVVGTARIVGVDDAGRVTRLDDARAAKIGRMAVPVALRRGGIGRALLEQALDHCALRGIARIELSAQAHAIAFYEKSGFRAEGDPYEEAGIPHRRMTLALVMRDEAIALFEKRRRAWLAEDLEEYLALWTEDTEFRSPAHAEPLRGRDAFAELVRRSFEFARPRRFDFHEIAVVGNRVLAEWTIAIAPRNGGGEIEWRGMSIARLCDGRIAWWREYWNPADLLPR
ncbi:MAG: GNAT family N-acetyltransferase [Candidatus Binatia bacterium]